MDEAMITVPETTVVELVDLLPLEEREEFTAAAPAPSY